MLEIATDARKIETESRRWHVHDKGYAHGVVPLWDACTHTTRGELTCTADYKGLWPQTTATSCVFLLSRNAMQVLSVERDNQGAANNGGGEAFNNTSSTMEVHGPTEALPLGLPE